MNPYETYQVMFMTPKNKNLSLRRVTARMKEEDLKYVNAEIGFFDENFIDFCEALKANTQVESIGIDVDSDETGSLTGTCAMSILCEAIKKKERLTTLRLTHVFDNAECCRVLFAGIKSSPELMKSLKTIGLRTNSIAKQESTYISEFLMTTVANLTNLDLDLNDIDDDSCEELCKGLQENEKVTELSMGYNLIGKGACKALRTCLIHNSHLRTLWLDKNFVNDEGVVMLANGLEQNTALKSISLVQNKITDAGIRALLKALEINTTLETLDLEGAKCGDSIIPDLRIFLKDNSRLKHLTIGLNDNVKNFGAKEIMESLRTNYHIIDLFLLNEEGLQWDPNEASAFNVFLTKLQKRNKELNCSVNESFHLKTFCAHPIGTHFPDIGIVFVDDILN